MLQVVLVLALTDVAVHLQGGGLGLKDLLLFQVYGGHFILVVVSIGLIIFPDLDLVSIDHKGRGVEVAVVVVDGECVDVLGLEHGEVTEIAVRDGGKVDLH